MKVKDSILALLLVAIGVVVLVAPETLAWLVSIAFTLTGVMKLIPESSRK